MRVTKKKKWIARWLVLVVSVTFLLCGCDKNSSETDQVSQQDIEESESSDGVIGGIAAYEEKETVSLGGILSGANAEDVKELEDSIDLEEIENMSEEQRQQLVGGLDVLADQHNMIVSRVVNAFEESDVDADINEETGKITMDENILFGVNEDSISSKGKAYLDKFIKTYADALLNGEGEQYVSEIRVLGHTDTSGDYDYNMKLSQRRAEAVKNYCIDSTKNGLSKEQKEKLKKLMTVKGMAYDEPIYDGDKINMEASRRVEFKIMMNLDN